MEDRSYPKIVKSLSFPHALSGNPDETSAGCPIKTFGHDNFGIGSRLRNRFSIFDFSFSGKSGQVMMEFAFSMVVLFLMMYGIVMVFRWAGLDLVARQQTHEAVLTSGGPPEDQITPDFYTPTKMETVWGGP